MATKWTKEQRDELRRLKRQDRVDFLEEWDAERGKYPGGFVPARMMGMTGAILHELEQDGVIESDGNSNYRPTGYR